MIADISRDGMRKSTRASSPSSMDQTFTSMSLVCPIRSSVTPFGTCSALPRSMARCSRSMRMSANRAVRAGRERDGGASGRPDYHGNAFGALCHHLDDGLAATHARDQQAKRPLIENPVAEPTDHADQALRNSSVTRTSTSECVQMRAWSALSIMTS